MKNAQIPKDHILNINKKKLAPFSRISNIGDLIDITNNIDIPGKKSVLNPDTITAAKFIIESIKTILNLDPEEIKKSKISPVVKKIGNEYAKKGGFENNAIGNLMENISLQASNTFLRLERKQKSLDSITDGLTGLANRKKLDSEIEKHIELKNRSGTYFPIILLDIDFFKKVNDTLGHVIGDKVLIELAKLLKANCRQNDIVGRWGGEEFAIILPETTIVGATIKAENIRKIIEETLSSKIENIDWDITVSIGVTQIEDKPTDKEKLTKKVDQALYGSKNTGRNKVLIQLYHPKTTCGIEKCEKCKVKENCI